MFNILWAYKTISWEVTGEISFSLVYGIEAVALVEIGVESAQIESYGDDNMQLRALDLDLIEEKGEIVALRLIGYK